MRTCYKKTSPLFQFTLSYLLILVIPLIMGLLNFWYVLDFATKKTVYTITLILKNSMEGLENSLKSIATYSRTLNQLKVLDDIVSINGQQNVDLLDLQNAVEQYPILRDDSRYVDIHFLYSGRNDIILAPLQAFLNVEMYYGTYFDFGDMSFAEWRDQILRNPSKPDGVVLLGNENGKNRLVYQTPYLSHKDGKVAGQQIFLLDENRINKALEPAFEMGAGFTYIEDANGNLLVTMEQDGWIAQSAGPLGTDLHEGSVERIINGKRMMVTYCKSSDYGLTYVIAIPKSTLISTALTSLSMSLALMIVLAIFGIVIIFGAYKYNISPLMSIADHLLTSPLSGKASRKRAGNGLWLLSGSVTSLVTDNSRMEEQIKLQQEALQQSLYVQIVTGKILDEDNLSDMIHSCGISTENVRIRGVYLKILSREPLTPLINDTVRELTVSDNPLIELILCFWIDNRHLSLLCIEHNDATSGEFMDLLRNVHFRIMEECGLETIFSIGSECVQYAEVHQSFSEARKLLVSDVVGSPILRISFPDPTRRENYIYGQREEDALLKLASGGLFDEVKGILNKIKKVNFQDRMLNLEMRELLFYRMASTLLCAGWDVDLPLSRTSLSSMETTDFFEMLSDKYNLVCEQNTRNFKESNERMKNEIVAHIDQNFCDRNMSLSLLSQRFSVTESYLSTLIKGLVGENFSSYLETKRIDEANRLLKNNEMSVTEIGYFVGYDSATSFGRAYKRVMGHSPSQYARLNNHKS